MSIQYTSRLRAVTLAALVAFGLTGIGCVGGSSNSSSGSLSGNWQISMTQNYPQISTLSASGFLVEDTEGKNGGLSGSVQGPTILGSSQDCGGAGPVNGTVTGENVTFSLNPGGTVFNFTGVVKADNSMSGTYSGLAGACFQAPTSGAFTAQLIPPLNGSFSGTLLSRNYMGALTGSTSQVPVSVSGSFTQSPSAVGSSATLTGTITALNYPCFTTASLKGTISGSSVYLAIYGYNGVQIGTIGNVDNSSLGEPAYPATVGLSPLSLIGTGAPPDGSGFSLGPCPTVYNSDGLALTTDSGNVTLNFN